MEKSVRQKTLTKARDFRSWLGAGGRGARSVLEFVRTPRAACNDARDEKIGFGGRQRSRMSCRRPGRGCSAGNAERSAPAMPEGVVSLDVGFRRHTDLAVDVLEMTEMRVSA